MLFDCTMLKATEAIAHSIVYCGRNEDVISEILLRQLKPRTLPVKNTGHIIFFWVFFF